MTVEVELSSSPNTFKVLSYIRGVTEPRIKLQQLFEPYSTAPTEKDTSIPNPRNCSWKCEMVLKQ
jgi:hypothetical protein